MQPDEQSHDLLTGVQILISQRKQIYKKKNAPTILGQGAQSFRKTLAKKGYCTPIVVHVGTENGGSSPAAGKSVASNLFTLPPRCFAYFPRSSPSSAFFFFFVPVFVFVFSRRHQPPETSTPMPTPTPLANAIVDATPANKQEDGRRNPEPVFDRKSDHSGARLARCQVPEPAAASGGGGGDGRELLSKKG